jgi:CubicO group peptidase (beta-lactamase class C family)
VGPGFRRDDDLSESDNTHMRGKAEAAEELDRVFRRAVEAGEVPGVVALAADDRGLLYEGAFGVRDLNTAPAMTLDTVFRIFR